LKLYFLVLLFTRSISVMFKKTYLSHLILMRNFFMNVCMYAWLCNKKGWQHGPRFKSTMMESMVRVSHGKNYGFHLYMYHGFYQVPKVIDPFRILLGYGTDSQSNNIRKKVPFECSIACQLIPRLILVSHRITP